MRIKSMILPALTAAAVLFALLLPQNFSAQRDKKHLNVLHREHIDETALVTSYNLSVSERLHLLRYSGILAQNGAITYGKSGAGVSVTVRPARIGDPAERTEAPGGVALPMLKEDGLTEHIHDYLFQGLVYLLRYGVIDESRLEDYRNAAERLQVDYCTVTDDDDPFFSMTLLCISTTLAQETNGELACDTSFSLVMDEENGAIYALSLFGDPALVLTEEPLRYAVLADLMGASFTEYETVGSGKENYPSAVFNFGGYSYQLRQKEQRNGCAGLDFNLNSDQLA